MAAAKRQCVFTVPGKACVYSDADAPGAYVVRVLHTGELLEAGTLAAAIEVAKLEAAAAPHKPSHREVLAAAMAARAEVAA